MTKFFVIIAITVFAWMLCMAAIMNSGAKSRNTKYTYIIDGSYYYSDNAPVVDFRKRFTIVTDSEIVNVDPRDVIIKINRREAKLAE